MDDHQVEMREIRQPQDLTQRAAQGLEHLSAPLTLRAQAAEKPRRRKRPNGTDMPLTLQIWKKLVHAVTRAFLVNRIGNQEENSQRSQLHPKLVLLTNQSSRNNF